MRVRGVRPAMLLLTLVAGCALLAAARDAAAQPEATPTPVQRERLQRALEKYQAGQAREIEAQLERKADGTVVLETKQDPAVQLEVANPEGLSQRLEAVPLKVKVVLTPRDELRIQKVDLEATSKWKETPYSSQDRFEAVTQRHRAVEEAFERAKRPEATVVEQRVLRETIADATVALGEAYDRVQAEDEKAALRAQYRALRRTGKAIYGSNRDDRYPPASYQAIYDTSRAGVALARKGERDPHCSGFLVGKDLVLTNDHCVRGELPGDLEARFDYEEDLRRRPLDEVRIPVKSFLLTSATNGSLDFALLELEATPDNRSAGDLFPPLCVSTARVRQDDPVYVIGHPQGLPRTIHDNGFVYFPFRVTEPEMQLLALHVDAEFEGAEDATVRIEEFRSSYRQRTLEGAVIYENFSQRWGGQPTIGVDTDTFHGNSGSPVLHRRTQLVVGILFDGEEDLTTPFEIGWRAHEAVLPMSEVVAKLDQFLPEWRNRSGICVDGS